MILVFQFLHILVVHAVITMASWSGIIDHDKITIIRPNDSNLTTQAPINCTSYIPGEVSSLMRQYSSALAVNDNDSYFKIPRVYLAQCILDQDYDARISPQYFQTNPYINIKFAISQLVELDFTGVLKVIGSFDLEWVAPRITWNLNSDIPRWIWPTTIYLDPKFFWRPNLIVLNCPNMNSKILFDIITSIYI